MDNLNSLNRSRKKDKLFTSKKNVILTIATLVLFACLLPFLSGTKGGLAISLPVNDEDMDLTTLNSLNDSDQDGLSDELENMLGTDNNNKYGDKDMDGLYDFEEYLDYYGTPDNLTDVPKYQYNVSTTYEGILDIYHYFNLSVNKTGYIRDNSTYTEKGNGFTDYLIWNVNFSGGFAGGDDTSAITYSDSILKNVTFSGYVAGGSGNHQVDYLNNVIIDVTYSGLYTGGSQSGFVKYKDNYLDNVAFSGRYAGGTREGEVLYENNSLNNVAFTSFGYAGGSFDRDVTYKNNVMNNVSFDTFTAGGSLLGITSYSNNSISDAVFTGKYAGGSQRDSVTYKENNFERVIFGGEIAGGSEDDKVTYENNRFTDVIFNGSDAGLSLDGSTYYTGNIFDRVQYSGIQNKLNKTLEFTNNTVTYDEYDSDGDGLMDFQELFVIGTSPASIDTDGDGLQDGWEVTYNARYGVDPLVIATSSELDSDMDNDTLTLSEEGEVGTDPENEDTDEDGLNDGIEIFAHTNPLDIDTDKDGLNDSFEILIILTNPLDLDSDSDGLNDSYEFEILYTNPLDLDSDSDGLNDSLEVLTLGTDPRNVDSDSDELSDLWEFIYNGSEGINPTVTATNAEVMLDNDDDGLTLWEESTAGTSPLLSDTDGDKLTDGWEVRYKGQYGVDPLIKASSVELESDIDIDGLTLLQEGEIGTNPNTNDTDEDGLSDEWEFQYQTLDGVNPLVRATTEELNSDRDGDGFTLLQEARENTDPSVPDEKVISISPTDSSSSNPLFGSEIDRDNSVMFAIWLGIAGFASLITIIVIIVIAKFLKRKNRRKWKWREIF